MSTFLQFSHPTNLELALVHYLICLFTMRLNSNIYSKVKFRVFMLTHLPMHETLFHETICFCFLVNFVDLRYRVHAGLRVRFTFGSIPMSVQYCVAVVLICNPSWASLNLNFSCNCLCGNGGQGNKARRLIFISFTFS